MPAPSANWDAPAWQLAETLRVTHFPWEDSGHRPNVQARALYDSEALYIHFRVEDQYVRAVAEKFQDSVCVDSCVEFFVSPLADSEAYFNFEVNCGGTMLLHRCPSLAEKAAGRATDGGRQRCRRCNNSDRALNAKDRRSRNNGRNDLDAQKVSSDVRTVYGLLWLPNTASGRSVARQFLQMC